MQIIVNGISVIFMTTHRCAGGLKKVDLRSGSQCNRHFVGFFKVPNHNWHQAILNGKTDKYKSRHYKDPKTCQDNEMTNIKTYFFRGEKSYTLPIASVNVQSVWQEFPPLAWSPAPHSSQDSSPHSCPDLTIVLAGQGWHVVVLVSI